MAINSEFLVRFTLISSSIFSYQYKLSVSVVIMRRVSISLTVIICAVITVATANYQDDALELHNKYRAQYGSPALALNDEVIFNLFI